MTGLADRLKELRTNNGIIQPDIAMALGISLRTYQRYERNERKPDTDMLIKMADYYNVSADYLLGRSDNPKRR